MTTQHTKYNIQQIYGNPFFKEFCMIRNLKQSSIRSYAVVLNNYVQIQQTDINTLIQEADLEEEQAIRPSKRKIKQRLIQYKITLQEQKLHDRTINDRLTKIRTFYSQFDITPPNIPRNKVKHIETYKQLLTPEHIRKAVNTSKNYKIRAIILFMASSGTAAKETSNITIQDFIEATSEYHNETQIERVIPSLINRDDIVPTFNIIRNKTQTPYFTFCTPETTQYILTYLQNEILKRELHPNDSLFNISSQGIQTNLKRINDVCDFGWKTKTCRFFHSHGLRKFFGTTMFDAGLSELTVDFLEGRSIGATRQAYYKPRPEELKTKYLRVMNKVTFFNEITYQDITNKEKQELEMLRQKDKERDKQMKHIEAMIQEYKQLIS